MKVSTYRYGAYYLTGVTNGSDLYIVKFDDSGNKQWEHFITRKDDYRVSPEALYVTANHDIYLFGAKNNDQTKPSYMFMMRLKG
jgi:hypothetical protein